ncbi:hypothetical protein BTUL_0061g00060 [Botrytis tulipae]|uniref:Uncharacterized protein n=1 Tax=Botrytis tulipae TaxID=87230 RepID=A0A4Z1ERB3_9HELO|nr:hypothetical protein BTUL_0061g00060 [Botrytis tulipae]
MSQKYDVHHTFDGRGSLQRPSTSADISDYIPLQAGRENANEPTPFDVLEWLSVFYGQKVPPLPVIRARDIEEVPDQNLQETMEEYQLSTPTVKGVKLNPFTEIGIEGFPLIEDTMFNIVRSYPADEQYQGPHNLICGLGHPRQLGTLAARKSQSPHDVRPGTRHSQTSPTHAIPAAERKAERPQQPQHQRSPRDSLLRHPARRHPAAHRRHVWHLPHHLHMSTRRPSGEHSRLQQRPIPPPLCADHSRRVQPAAQIHPALHRHRARKIQTPSRRESAAALADVRANDAQHTEFSALGFQILNVAWTDGHGGQQRGLPDALTQPANWPEAFASKPMSLTVAMGCILLKQGDPKDPRSWNHDSRKIVWIRPDKPKGGQVAPRPV